MTTTILLVRHGQTRSNITGFYMGWSDEDLDEVGYSQARRLAARLAGWPIAAVYTSPLQRTYTTATILAKPHGLELQVLDDLGEIRLGDWQGRHTEEVKQKWPELWQQSRTDPSEVTMPGGESFRQVTERAVRAFDAIIAADRGKQTAIVTHEAVVKVLVAHALGTTNSIYRRFEINNTSLSMIRIIDGKARLAMLNDTSHLESLEQD